MQKQYILEDDINRVLASMNSKGSEEDTGKLKEEKPEEFDIYIEPDRITVVKRPEIQPQIIESAPVTTQKTSLVPAYAICLFYLVLILSTLLFQVYEIVNPPIATISIVPKTKTVTFSGTLQLGRLLQPITISQSQTVSTTGKGHQDARSAIGYITFYNGLFTSQTIQAGTVLTGADGIQIITDQTAFISAANPPILGYATVSAHAQNPGVSGNISAYDINQACCATAIKAVNTTSFQGGQDERNYQTVAKRDIDTTASPLKTAVAQSMQGALQGQVKPPEQLQILPCSSTISPDHKAGDEAKKVTVTVSETCSAIAYNREALDQKATDLLTRQAVQNLGTGYSLVGKVQITVKRATITHTPPLVFLSFHAQGTWIYALSQTAQQHIKVLIAGKSKQQALHVLLSLPGIERAAISWGDDTRLPKDTGYIHIRLFVV